MRRTVQSPGGRHRLAAGPPLCVAHRGARAFAPENTLEALAKAAALQCPMVELDVHLTQDGLPVVHHDDTLARCTDVASKFPGRAPFFISEFTLAELKTLDAGRWYAQQLDRPATRRQDFLRSLSDAEVRRFVSDEERRHFASGEVRIPTLDEALASARQFDLMLDIEIKALPRLYPGMAAKVVAAIASAGLKNSVLVSSFDHEQLVTVRRLDRDIATGVLTSDRLALPADYLAYLDADAYLPGCSGATDSLGFGSTDGRLELDAIRAVLATGRSVLAWTCNEAGAMARLADAGVSGIVTDYPNRFEAVRPPRKARTA